MPHSDLELEDPFSTHLGAHDEVPLSLSASSSYSSRPCPSSTSPSLPIVDFVQLDWANMEDDEDSSRSHEDDIEEEMLFHALDLNADSPQRRDPLDAEDKPWLLTSSAEESHSDWLMDDLDRDEWRHPLAASHCPDELSDPPLSFDSQDNGEDDDSSSLLSMSPGGSEVLLALSEPLLPSSVGSGLDAFSDFELDSAHSLSFETPDRIPPSPFRPSTPNLRSIESTLSVSPTKRKRGSPKTRVTPFIERAPSQPCLSAPPNNTKRRRTFLTAHIPPALSPSTVPLPISQGATPSDDPPTRIPTQAEMDAFFVYVEPPRSSLPATPRPPTEKSAAKARRHTAAAPSPAPGSTPIASASLSKQRGKRSQTLAASASSSSGQLLTIPVLSSVTGLTLTSEEKRLAIIHSLEQAALSILIQLVDGALPPPASPVTQDANEEEDAASESQTSPVKGKRSRTKQVTQKKKAPSITVTLTKRSAPTSSRESPADGQLSTKKIVFPRRNARGDGLGGASLATFLKAIELILDALKRKVVVTKRDLFYRSVKLFGRQARVDAIVEDIAAALQVRREDLNVVAAAKGLVGGYVKLVRSDGIVLEGGSEGSLIPPSSAIARIQYNDVKWVLIIEKEAVFQTLCTPSFLQHANLPGHGILLTGKGYPDLATRELVKRISTDLPSVPLLCLVDSDPHGLEILSTYKFGSASLAFDTANLTVNRIEWLGIKGSEWDALGVDRAELLALTLADRKKALKMLTRDNLPDDWKHELQYMLHLQRKAEIQILSSTLASSSKSPPSQDSPLVQYVLRKLHEACMRTSAGSST